MSKKISKIWGFFTNPPGENLTGTGSFCSGIRDKSDRTLTNDELTV
jgi:hypothetical protein